MKKIWKCFYQVLDWEDAESPGVDVYVNLYKSRESAMKRFELYKDMMWLDGNEDDYRDRDIQDSYIYIEYACHSELLTVVPVEVEE